MAEQTVRRRILVVDDEERMVRFIRMNLEHDGYQVTEALNGKQAISLEVKKRTGQKHEEKETQKEEN